ncbi:MAG TPA: transposase [Acidimicrobiia bacterium]|nr:transposase [Acidimicrobiia bacterium]
MERSVPQPILSGIAEDRNGGLGRARLGTHAIRVADPFHVVRAANRCLDQVRRRVQNETKVIAATKTPVLSDPQAPVERARNSSTRVAGTGCCSA